MELEDSYGPNVERTLSHKKKHDTPSTLHSSTSDGDVPSSKAGRLLYEIEEGFRFCDCTKEWNKLEFYEHLVVWRAKVNWGCCPKTYRAEVIPRFKIMDVTFTNGRRNMMCWIITLFIIGMTFFIPACMMISRESSYSYSTGPSGSSIFFLLLGIVVTMASMLPLLCCRKHRYVTFDVKGRNPGSWFSRNSVFSIRFLKNDPNEEFMIDYVYGALRQNCEPMHALSHLNSAALAHPLKSELTNDIRTCLSLSEDLSIPKGYTSNRKTSKKEKKKHKKTLDDSTTSISYSSGPHETPYRHHEEV